MGFWKTMGEITPIAALGRGDMDQFQRTMGRNAQIVGAVAGMGGFGGASPAIGQAAGLMGGMFGGQGGGGGMGGGSGQGLMGLLGGLGGSGGQGGMSGGQGAVQGRVLDPTRDAALKQFLMQQQFSGGAGQYGPQVFGSRG